MPTVDDLRTALNDLAADTPGLSSDDMLRAGRRFRTRRRVMAVSGATLVVAAGLAFGLTGPNLAAPPVTSAPTDRATTAVVPIEQLFEATGELEAESGVHTRAFTYLAVPSELRFQATARYSRVKAPQKLPDTVDVPLAPPTTVTLDGVPVTVTLQATDEGVGRFLTWTHHGSNYYLSADPERRTGEEPTKLPHGPNDTELYALVEWINEGN